MIGPLMKGMQCGTTAPAITVNRLSYDFQD